MRLAAGFPSLGVLVLLAFALAGCGDGMVGPGEETEEWLLFLSDRDAEPNTHGNRPRDFFRVRADGTGLENISQAPEFFGMLSLSPDGSRVAFGSCNIGLWSMRTDGTDRLQLTNVGTEGGGDRCNYHPRWSPDGTRIAFATTREYRHVGPPGWTLYVMNADGSDPRNVSSPVGEEEGGIWNNPVGWTPDGRVVFDYYRRVGEQTFTIETFVARAEGGGVESVFGRPDDYAAHWSPDGSMITFLRREGDANHLMVTNANGTGLRALSGEAGDYWLPSSSVSVGGDDHDPWSPDGTRIAYTVQRNEGGAWWTEIHVVNVDGTGHLQLTPSGMRATFGGWSPRGDRIAFSGREGGASDVYLIDADGSGMVNITGSLHADTSPMWLPRP
jgi:Tol biopolymer transport system component